MKEQQRLTHSSYTDESWQKHHAENSDRSMDGNDLLIIIPAYNESHCILQVIHAVQSLAYDYIVVNDGSTDDTVSICRQCNAPTIDLPFNQGLAGAFQAGMRYAQLHGYRYAMQFDADGQHLPQYIPVMLEKAKEGYDIVVGSRFMNQAHGLRTARRIGMSLIRAIIQLTTGKTLTDPTSGMRMYDSTMIALFANGVNFGPEPDTLAYLIRNGATVAEVPVNMMERISGRSYLTYSTSIKYMCRMIVSILLVQFIRPKVHLAQRVSV